MGLLHGLFGVACEQGGVGVLLALLRLGLTFAVQQIQRRMMMVISDTDGPESADVMICCVQAVGDMGAEGVVGAAMAVATAKAMEAAMTRCCSSLCYIWLLALL